LRSDPRGSVRRASGLVQTRFWEVRRGSALTLLVRDGLVTVDCFPRTVGRLKSTC